MAKFNVVINNTLQWNGFAADSVEAIINAKSALRVAVVNSCFAEQVSSDRPVANPQLMEFAKTNKELKELIDCFESTHDDIENNEYNSDDGDEKQYIYEAAAKLIYGQHYFKWLNKQS